MRVDEALKLVKDLNEISSKAGAVDKFGKPVNYKVTHTKGVNGYSVQPIVMVEKTNLMSGGTFFIDEDTPIYLDPSSESYWSA